MLHVHAKNSHSGGQDCRTGYQSKQAKYFDAAEDADEQQQFIKMGAIAKQERAHDVVGHSGDESANRSDEQSSADVAGERQPKRGRYPYQRGTYNRNQREKRNQHAPEDCGANSRKGKSNSSQKALNGGDQQANRNAGEYEFL